jgi:hypothetical protein
MQAAERQPWSLLPDSGIEMSDVLSGRMLDFRRSYIRKRDAADIAFTGMGVASTGVVPEKRMASTV